MRDYWGITLMIHTRSIYYWHTNNYLLGVCTIRVYHGFSCSDWYYVVVCTTIVQPCSTRQKQSEKDKNNRNKFTKTHHILQDKNDQKKTKVIPKNSQKHKMVHSNVQFSDSYKSLHSIVPKNHTNTNRHI